MLNFELMSIFYDVWFEYISGVLYSVLFLWIIFSGFFVLCLESLNILLKSTVSFVSFLSGSLFTVLFVLLSLSLAKRLLKSGFFDACTLLDSHIATLLLVFLSFRLILLVSFGKLKFYINSKNLFKFILKNLSSNNSKSL